MISLDDEKEVKLIKANPNHHYGEDGQFRKKWQYLNR